MCLEPKSNLVNGDSEVGESQPDLIGGGASPVAASPFSTNTPAPAVSAQVGLSLPAPPSPRLVVVF